MLSVVTIASLVGWMRRLFWRQSRLKFVRHYLKVVSALPPVLDSRDRQQTRQFVEEYLTPDTFFLIRLIGANSGDLLASELIHELWLGFTGRSTIPQSFPPTRLCSKHALASCDYCYFGGRSKPYGGLKSEGRIFGGKYYPGEKSPPRQKISSNLLQHLQFHSPASMESRLCPCEETEMSTEKSITGKTSANGNGGQNPPEDIV